MPKHAIAAGALLALCAGPALADLTAEGLWADWQETYRALGSTLTAESADYSDGRLALEGVTATGTTSGVETTTSFGALALVERGDGSVAIELPATTQLRTETVVEGETQVQVIDVATEGWSGVAREEGDARVYDLGAASMTFALEDDSGDAPVDVAFALAGLEADYRTSEAGGTMAFDQTVAVETFTLDAEGGGAEPFDMTYVMSGIALRGDGTLNMEGVPEQPSLSDLGLVLMGEATHSGSTTALTGTAQGGPFQFEGASEAGRIGFEVGAEAVSYDIASTGATMALQLAAFPLPVNASLAEVATGVTLPVGVSDGTQPFGMSVALRELDLDDQIWSLFDPTGQLPRDPATVVIDLDGTAAMTADLFDPEAMAGLGAPPGELRTLEIAELLVSLAGARLTGEGAVTFAEGAPVPQPVGTVTLALEGGFALLDGLVALGFLPAEQATFIRGMAGVVAQPVGEDSLRSEIEFTEGGGITANGMALR
jgi:hypothetical protein